MERFVIMTVGKTHSGKTSFAKQLESSLRNSVVIDQDNHAEFLHHYYPKLIPIHGSNKIKYALTQAVVDHVVHETNFHLILANSNLDRTSRVKRLRTYQSLGFKIILVVFDLPTELLGKRIAESSRSTSILRTVSTFKEVLMRQNEVTYEQPDFTEANYLFKIQISEEVDEVVTKICNLVRSAE